MPNKASGVVPYRKQPQQLTFEREIGAEK